MRAIQYAEFGPPEVLELVELPEPHAAPDQIRVVVNAVGVNPVDWKFRRGTMGGDLPRRTGLEVAGVVDEVGDEIADVTAGDHVFGPVAGGNGAADFALLAAYAPIPAALDFVGAAALPVAVETAWRTLDRLGVGEGMTIVVNGASGSVGVSTVQLARERGAAVIGTAGEANQEYVRSFGAQATTYGPGLAERVRALAGGEGAVVDRALDDAGGGALPSLIELTGDPDRVLTIADFEDGPRLGVQMSGGPDEPRAWQALSAVTELVEAGRFTLPVAETFELEGIAEAHRLSETMHARGKIVLLVD